MITITLTPKTPAQLTAAIKLLEQFNADPELVARASLSVEQVKDLADAQANREDNAAREALQAERAAKKPKAAKTATAAPAATETPSDSSISAETPASTATPASPSEITLEQVRAKLAALSQAGKAPEVKKLIASTGATKLTDVPAEKYGELLAAAEELA